jgi:predicted nucleic acid-binding protein
LMARLVCDVTFVNDSQIAAKCDLTLVIYNIKDYQFIAGLKIIVPPFPTI